MCYVSARTDDDPADTGLRARCPRSLTGGRHVWYFDTAPDGKLRHRCVWCKRWYEQEQH